MKKLTLTLVIFCLVNLLNLSLAEDLVILSLNYEITVNGKYRFLTSVGYEWSEYPRILETKVLTKPLGTIPHKYQIISTTTSKSELKETPRLLSHNVRFIQGNTEILQSVRLDKNKGTEIKTLITHNFQTFETNLLTNYVECLDIPSLLMFISDKKLSGLQKLNIFYDSSFTNISPTNLTELGDFGIRKDNFVRLKEISGFMIVDKFTLKGVTIGVFTNVEVDGRLVDIKIADKSRIISLQNQNSQK
ncbi:MAG: hypothetical protein ABDH28_07990 [Brevinematia bacterium]